LRIEVELLARYEPARGSASRSFFTIGLTLELPVLERESEHLAQGLPTRD
jgi:hypothetical protein